MERLYQGTLDAGVTVLYTCPIGQTVRSANLRFTNAVDYGLKLMRKEPVTGATIILYDFSLSGGDVVVDGSSYYLTGNDSLIVETTVGGTDYMLQILTNP